MRPRALFGAGLLLALPLAAGCGARSGLFVDSTTLAGPSLSSVAGDGGADGAVVVPESVCRFPPALPDNPHTIEDTPASVVALRFTSNSVAAIALDDQNVYFAESNGTSKGSISAVGKDGSNLRLLADQQDDPTSIAVISPRVFWTTHTSIVAYPIPFAGTSAYPLDNYTGRGGAVTDGQAVFVETIQLPSGATQLAMFPNAKLSPQGAFEEDDVGTIDHLGALAVDDSYVYYARGADPATATIARRAKTNQAAEEVLVTGLSSLLQPTMLAVASGCVYFLNADAGEVLAVPASGGKPLAIATKLPKLTSLALDDGHAWVTTAAGDVMSIEEGSGRVQRRRRAGTPALGVAVDAKSFYWIENSATEGSVRTAFK